jgi:hypothetical protein
MHRTSQCSQVTQGAQKNSMLCCPYGKGPDITWYLTGLLTVRYAANPQSSQPTVSDSFEPPRVPSRSIDTTPPKQCQGLARTQRPCQYKHAVQQPQVCGPKMQHLRCLAAAWNDVFAHQHLHTRVHCVHMLHRSLCKTALMHSTMLQHGMHTAMPKARSSCRPKPGQWDQNPVVHRHHTLYTLATPVRLPK